MVTFTNSEDPDEISSGSTLFVNTILPDTPRYDQWTIPSLMYQTRRKNSLVYKGLIP